MNKKFLSLALVASLAIGLSTTLAACGDNGGGDSPAPTAPTPKGNASTKPQPSATTSPKGTKSPSPGASGKPSPSPSAKPTK